ncbi:acyl-CoA dehydrogenase family protein [Streptomyces aurantiacus]|uniref:Putative Short-chain specific acyl-CoA dehydrogenase n=1 Tax=Streptomyces aurantiacus JA 4570 TaxID=1286094 RepID=S3Z935_9ACTN|nr:acyl-CoA dehydrogenase family protein [Streptomyces aurantiacus]EPH39623.1 putative Short-chain specific acyl-CoA dehydrogenase [Streptomyces aurantiacus JA 4570]
MDFGFGPADEDFRREARAWLEEHLTGEFAAAAGQGGPGSEHERGDVRRAWERELGRGGWIGIGWDAEGDGSGQSAGGGGEASYGARRASLTQQVVWAEEYARVRAPARCGHVGENLLAPTLLAYGTREQKDEFLPPIARGEALWCQGYSEPGAGSDLAGVRTTAVRDENGGGAQGTYRVTGQKIWTSLAHEADWCFVLARTEPGSRRHHGLSFLLVPMDQPGRIDVRPIRQLTGTSEFNEVFFDGARARAAHIVGGEGNGWRVAMGLLGFERGVSTLAQQIGFAQELDRVVREALRAGAAADPVLRDRLTRQWADLRVMRWNALRTLGSSGTDVGSPSVAKLLWGGWHQRLGELAMAVRGTAAAVGPADWSADAPYELDALQRLFLFSRADTVYGGSDEIQRNIIAERVLGLPREAKGPVRGTP